MIMDDTFTHAQLTDFVVSLGEQLKKARRWMWDAELEVKRLEALRTPTPPFTVTWEQGDFTEDAP